MELNMSVTSVRIEDGLEQLLEATANDMHRSKGWIINEALRKYLQHKKAEKERWQDTLEALEDIRMGRIIDGSKVHAWLESWGTNEESEEPQE
jgi:predicted transcriptional regulator